MRVPLSKQDTGLNHWRLLALRIRDSHLGIHQLCLELLVHRVQHKLGTSLVWALESQLPYQQSIARDLILNKGTRIIRGKR